VISDRVNSLIDVGDAFAAAIGVHHNLSRAIANRDARVSAQRDDGVRA
jgi:hypothetical protein